MQKKKNFYIIEPEGFKKMDIEVIITDNGYHCVFENLDFINHYSVKGFYVKTENGYDKFQYAIYLNKRINELNQSNSKEILNDDIVSKIWNCIKEKIDNPDYVIEIKK